MKDTVLDVRSEVGIDICTRFGFVCPNPKAINSLSAELNPICHLLALLGAHHILHVSKIWVKLTHTRTSTNFSFRWTI